MKRILIVTGAACLVFMPTPTMADAVHDYTVVRVNTGSPGPILSDKAVTTAISWADRFWRGIPGAPPLRFTIVHNLVTAPGAAPGCAMDVGRSALGLAAGHPTITFLATGYPCFGDGTAHAVIGGIDVEARWPADGHAIAHEIGHNLGFDHDRTNETLPQLAPTWEYGNPFSIMGGGQWAPSAVQQAKLGWLTIRPMPKRKGWWRLRDLQGKAGPRAFTFTAKGHVYVLEYRIHRSVVDTPGGVAIYEDGVILHDKNDTKYTVLPGKSWTVSGVKVSVDKRYRKDRFGRYARVTVSGR